MRQNNISGAQAIERALKLLDVLALSEKPLALIELSNQIELHKSTLHRLLSVLQQYGYVFQDNGTKKYRLGLKFLEMSSYVTGNIQLLQIATPFLEKLRNDSGETVHLVIRDGDKAVYIGKFESSQAVRLHSRIGERIPLHSTAVGKIILSGLSNDEILKIARRKRLKRYTDKTITSSEQLIKEIEKIRKSKIAIDDRESQEDVRCVAAGIRNSQSCIIAALSISGPSARMSKKKISTLIRLIAQCADEISGRIE